MRSWLLSLDITLHPEHQLNAILLSGSFALFPLESRQLEKKE